MALHQSENLLGDFLRSRRSSLKPQAVGIKSYGQRRVAGLRREEVAMLAGLSPTYYTRLEQGTSTNASTAVLDSLASALQLDTDERAHLHDLSHGVKNTTTSLPRPPSLSNSLFQLLDAMNSVPTTIFDRSTSVLGWNALGHALLAPHLPFDAKPNLTRLLFLDEPTINLYPDRTDELIRAVSSLRMIAGRHSLDEELTLLIGELCRTSSEFATLWARHPVKTCISGTKKFRHPYVGELTLQFETMHLSDDSGRRLISYTAEPSSPSDVSLRLLGSIARPGQQVTGITE